MPPAWQADTSAAFVRRLGKSAQELGQTDDREKCPDLWLLDNGDVAVVGLDCTEAYRTRLPDDMVISAGERLVVIPGSCSVRLGRISPMRDLLTTVDLDLTGGDWLTSEEYSRDFAERDARVVGRDSWKLERRQDFREESNASFEAMRRGDWPEALRLIESRRERLLRIEREENARGHFFHRIRIVGQPLTPYIQWELHSLRLRDECGERIRVMDAEKVRPLERGGPLPELVVLGGETLYEVRYADDGLAEGAVRHTDPEMIARIEAFLRRLYADSEDIQSFFAREVAHLPPPRPEQRAE